MLVLQKITKNAETTVFHYRRPLEHSAVELTYLAVKREIQGNGIGGTVLGLLVRMIRDVSEKFPIRYIVLHALRAKIEFYHKRGFQTLGEAGRDEETQLMYLDCLEERKELEEYLQQFE